MRQIIATLSILLMFTNGFAQENNNRKFYVGTFTSEGAEGIYLCNFNTETGDISLTETFKGIDNPSFLKISPDKKYLYAATRSPKQIEESGGFVSAYKIAENGALQFLNKQISNGIDPCFVDVSEDGNIVAIATYGGGTTSIYPVGENGKLMTSTSVIINEGTGPNQSRQEKPHAHSIKFSPFEDKVFSADLGTDKLNIYTIYNDKLYAQDQEFVKFAPGSGPRHFDFHPNGKVIYVINELNSTITCVKKETAIWKEFQTISTLPPGFTGDNYCADIHISDNGQFLYASNRGDNSIAIYVIEYATKKLISVGTVLSEGDWPRNFVLSPEGKFMLVANQKSNDISVFRINKDAGIPEFTGKKLSIPSPVCLEFL